MDEDESNLQDTIENDLKNRDNGPVRDKIEKEAKKQAKKAAKKAKDKMVNSLFKKVGASSTGALLPILIVIFMLIGIVSFVVTMPGLVQEMMLNKMLNMYTNLQYKLNGSDYYLTELARDEGQESQKKILMYLDDMGIDPVGFGFAAFYTRTTNPETGEDEVSYLPKMEIDDIRTVGGVIDSAIYNDEQTQKRLREDLILKYIISNERTYLVHDLDRLANSVIGQGTGIEILNDWLGKIKLKGMIETQIEGIDDSEISIDREHKQMIIESNNWSLLSVQTQTARYNLESWAGRYGMPLEFLLTLHIGTMTSDLTNEMLTNENLQTVMYVDSEKGEYDVDYEIRYKGHDLDIKRGKSSPNYDLVEWKGGMENYIIQKPDGSFGIDVSEDELESLRGVVSINSLYEWYNALQSMNLRQDINQSFITNSANDAKDAVLGYGMYRALYRIQANYYSSENWKNTSWYGNVEDADYTYHENWKYTWSFPTDENYSADEGFYGGIDASSHSYEETDAGVEFLFDMSDNTNPGSARGVVYFNNTDVEPYNFDELGYANVVSDAKQYNTAILHGINYYLDGHEDEVRQEYVRYGIACVLSQLDSYLYRCNLEELSPDITFTKYDNGSYDEEEKDWTLPLPRTDDEENIGRSELHLLITEEWLEFWENNPDPSTEEIHDELVHISDTIVAYFDIADNREQHIQEIIDDMLEKLGLDAQGITIEDIVLIHDVLQNNSDDFEFVLPRITRVMRHWYKDVIFEYNNITAYTPIDTLRYPLELEEENEDLEVTAVLTHRSGGQPYEQQHEPWVVKGDIVTMDGEIVRDETANEILNITDGTYRIGDGYRTTKKLFTQGKYYVYDGSQETAKSIWYAKELEKLNGADKKYAKAYVQSGRIVLSYVYDGPAQPGDFNGAYLGGNSWNVSSQRIDESRQDEGLGRLENAVKVADDGNWSVFLSMASVTNSTGLPVNLYYIVANTDMSYKSPAENDVSVTDQSVENINAMLEAMGVVTTRKPVSFDNQTEAGDVTTLTAFGLLEGMHTESAEHIYRDLKEFLIELGYYTKAEFDLIETNVLKWFIPDYMPITYEARKNWNQAEDTDNLKYGAIIYPKRIDEEGNVTNDGFEPDLDVIAPGNCRVIDRSETSITIEFDGISQPEIGALDKYTMIIDGIDVTTEPVEVELPDGSSATKTIAEIVGKEDVILAEQVIGKTADRVIQVILKNRIGGYINDIQDFMAPKSQGRGNYSTQRYEFTDDEILLLAYVIHKEAAPEGMAAYMDISNSVYATAEEQAMAFSEAVGYVLVNRALNNYMGLGTKIEDQSSDPSQYSSGYTIAEARAADAAGNISAGSKQAAEFCAQYGCEAIVNPNGTPMSEDVLGESAWTFGHRIFWWVDMNRNGRQDSYEGNSDPAWPYDVYLTYSN
jgi:hypothetical protein